MHPLDGPLSECDEAFLEDMEGFEKAVRRLVKVPLTANQYDALVSFCYNCGEGNLAKSTLLKSVNAGDHAGAAAEFHRWNKGGGKVLPGLTRRRASESLLYQGIPDLNYDGKADPTPPKRADAAGGRRTGGGLTMLALKGSPSHDGATAS